MPPPRILVVEDDLTVAFHVERMLERLGYEAVVTASGQEALAESETSPPDLVLMDITLPHGMNGIEAAARLRRRHNVPVVYLTGSTDDLTLGEAKATDPYGYLAKPFDETSLRLAVEVALNRFAADQRLEREILTISDREQARIGQNLHDGLGQILGGIAFMAKALEKRLEERELDEAAEAAKIVRLLDQAVAEARRIARGLHPRGIESHGLARALAELAGQTADIYKIAIHAHCDDFPVGEVETATHLYRIAQEAINNAVKHGKAGQIEVRFEVAPSRLSLTIADDGAGLSEGADHGTGMGLHLMRYRAQILGGSLDVARGGPRGGTVVACSCPWRRPR